VKNVISVRQLDGEVKKKDTSGSTAIGNLQNLLASILRLCCTCNIRCSMLVFAFLYFYWKKLSNWGLFQLTWRTHTTASKVARGIQTVTKWCNFT